MYRLFQCSLSALVIFLLASCGSSVPTTGSINDSDISAEVPASSDLETPATTEAALDKVTEDSTDLIVGGTIAGANEWPWATALVFSSSSSSNGNFCGGALIDSEWVLTAAHCLFDGFGREISPSSLDAVIGRSNLRNTNGERIDVVDIIVHPSYRPLLGPVGGSDIALLKLASPSGQPTLPLVNPSQTSLFAPGVPATVVGWGATSEGGFDSDPLREVTVPIVSNATCNSAYGGVVGSDMICAGVPQGGIDSCQGDSGGPLMAFNGSNWVSIGVVSWGEGCARPGRYGVYTRVATYVNWVNAQIGSGSQPPAGNPLQVGRSVNGSLTSADDNNPTRIGAYKDDYALTGIASNSVWITLGSSNFDTYLQIVDAGTGAVVATNDDRNRFTTNSGIFFRPLSGRDYLVRVTSYAVNETGSYSLSAR